MAKKNLVDQFLLKSTKGLTNKMGQHNQIVSMGTPSELGNYCLKNNKLERTKGGLSWFVASLFLLADMAGGGIVAMPTAIVFSSFYTGLFILFLMAFVSAISSVLLGEAWVIMLRLYPKYRTHCRKPYAEMGLQALGPKMMCIVSSCVSFTQFGASVVFLLLSAKHVNDFIRTAIHVDIGFCLMIIILALLLLPITLLKSPQDFWLVIIFGLISTFVAVLLVCWGAWNDRKCFGEQEMPEFSFPSVFTNLGTVLFSFGGHSAFPTIQVDMRKPSDFRKASYFGFSIIALINILVVLFGGLVYGSSLNDSVVTSIQTVWIRQAINLMISAHCLLTVTLIINPINQEFEEHFKVPQGFSVKRILLRTSMMAAVVFTAESLPNFGSVMELMGGSTVTLTSLVFPSLFFLFLNAVEQKSREQIDIPKENGNIVEASEHTSRIGTIDVMKRTNKPLLLLCIFICVVGTFMGIGATVSALLKMVKEHFVLPCYLNVFTTTNTMHNITSAFVCCGMNRTISLYDIPCSAYK